MGDKDATTKDDRLRRRFFQCLESFAKRGAVENAEWRDIEPDLGDHFHGDGKRLQELIKKVSDFFEMAGFPVLQLVYGGPNKNKEGTKGAKRISLKLRPFAFMLAKYREKRLPIVDLCVLHEALMPNEGESIYIGTGTTMRYLTERLIERMEKQRFEIVTDNLEALILCYFQGGETMMTNGNLGFMGCQIDWQEGTVNPMRPTSTVHTAYLSISTLTKEGEFRTRDEASRELTKAALNADGLKRVIFLMEGSKIDSDGQGNMGGSIGFDVVNTPSVDVFLVTDSLTASQRRIVEKLGITIIDLKTKPGTCNVPGRSSGAVVTRSRQDSTGGVQQRMPSTDREGLSGPAQKRTRRGSEKDSSR